MFQFIFPKTKTKQNPHAGKFTHFLSLLTPKSLAMVESWFLNMDNIFTTLFKC